MKPDAKHVTAGISSRDAKYCRFVSVARIESHCEILRFPWAILIWDRCIH